MPYIVLLTLAAIVGLQATGSIPQASVGGSLVIGFVLILGALAVGLHEAWTNRRGAVGWIVNILVTFVGALAAAQLGGLIAITLLKGFMGGSSLAATGGPVLYVALTIVTIITLLGAWLALQIVNRLR